MASEILHEPVEKLKPETINIHRAIVSLMEELEAIDWYRQRADVCTEPQLRAILEHNMNEEIEHASMALEWIRRNVPKFDEAMKRTSLPRDTLSRLKKQPRQEKNTLLQPQTTAPKFGLPLAT